MSNEIEHVDTDEIICPSCGYELEHNRLHDIGYQDGDYVRLGHRCAYCKSAFTVVDTTTYTTTKIEPEERPDD